MTILFSANYVFFSHFRRDNIACYETQFNFIKFWLFGLKSTYFPNVVIFQKLFLNIEHETFLIPLSDSISIRFSCYFIFRWHYFKAIMRLFLGINISNNSIYINTIWMESQVICITKQIFWLVSHWKYLKCETFYDPLSFPILLSDLSKQFVNKLPKWNTNSLIGNVLIELSC